MKLFAIATLCDFLAWVAVAYRQVGRLLICGTVAWSLLAGVTAAAVTVYLSEAELGDGTTPGNLDLQLDVAPIGSTGAFSIWISTDVLVSAVDMSLFAVGDSLRFVGSSVPSYAPRWASSQNGSISVDATTVLNMAAFAVPGFSGTGLNPAAVGDVGYDPLAGAFHIATIDYEIVGWGTTDFWLLPAGHGASHSLSCTQFGVGDECRPKDASYPAVDIPGVPGYPLNPTADGSITVVPEPAAAMLFGLGLLCLARIVRRQRC